MPEQKIVTYRTSIEREAPIPRSWHVAELIATGRADGYYDREVAVLLSKADAGEQKIATYFTSPDRAAPIAPGWEVADVMSVEPSQFKGESGLEVTVLLRHVPLPGPEPGTGSPPASIGQQPESDNGDNS